MSCACENRKLGTELERIRRLAKAYATEEQTDVAIYRREDGTYDFCEVEQMNGKTIVELISKY
jgi:hypothetical protein